jgi:hypothetical protein
MKIAYLFSPMSRWEKKGGQGNGRFVNKSFTLDTSENN